RFIAATSRLPAPTPRCSRQPPAEGFPRSTREGERTVLSRAHCQRVLGRQRCRNRTEGHDIARRLSGRGRSQTVVRVIRFPCGRTGGYPYYLATAFLTFAAAHCFARATNSLRRAACSGETPPEFSHP